MKLRNKKHVLSLSITLALTLTNCATQLHNTPDNKTQINNSIINNTLTQIKGKVTFPLRTKATIAEVKALATVSLIYPSDYPSAALRNSTIATGLGNDAGEFSFSLGSFSPETNRVYVLEAIKRIGGAGNFQMALRTNVRWTGTMWESMTTPALVINTVTTALAIIANLNPQDILSANTINTIPSPYGVPVSNINSKVTSALLTNVNGLVNQVLANDQDPVASTYFFGGQYLVKPNPALIGEFKVNTFTTGPQQNPAVAMDSNGDFVVVYNSGYGEGSGISPDGEHSGIFAQRYNNGGSAVGSEFQVNTFTTGNQQTPAVAMDSAGDFVVAWQSNNQDGSNFGVFAQRYNYNGVKVGSEFQVNTYTTGNQSNPSVAMDSAGDFVVSWQSFVPAAFEIQVANPATYGIYAQRYNSSGVKAGSEFRVNSFTANDQITPSVSMDSAGDFVVAWKSRYEDGSGDGIFAQRYGSTGSPVGSEFQVNTYSSSQQNNPAVAMDSAGDFVISWQSDGSNFTDNNAYSVQAQRYSSASTLTKVGSEFQVNTFTTGFQDFSSVAMDSAGDFVVAWQSNQDGNGDGIYAQRYSSASTLTKAGSEFQVNTFTLNNQNRPAIAMDSAGDFVVSWQSNGQDGGNYGVYAQRYNKNGVAK